MNEHEELSPDDEDAARRQDLSSRQADAFVVLWCSFLAASIGTMLMFAWIDPLTLTGGDPTDLDAGRMGGYAAGFFFLWALCAMSAILTTWLVRTQSPAGGTTTERQ